MRSSVLVVDDDPAYRQMLARMLDRRGFRVEQAASAEQAIERLATEPVDVVLTDVVMPGVDGLQLLARLRENSPDLPVVVMSGSGDIETALRAIREGAHDFLEKPTPDERLLVTLRNAIRFGRLGRRNRELERRGPAGTELLGESPAMQRLRRTLDKVAPTDGRVLILGENGSGKELVAAAIHRGSARADGPFVTLNCAAIPAELVESELFGHERGAFTGASTARRGRFEEADGGTLFLDEIGDMPSAMQAKLLRVLEQRRVQRVGGSRDVEVDVRVIAATNRDLAAMVDAGTFREDLYYRLAVVTITVPALRERREDVPLLAERFLADLGARVTIEPAALQALARHDWPGNVRELKNAIERLVILAERGRITTADVEEHLRTARRGPARPAGSTSPAPAYDPSRTLAEQLAEREREIVRAALAHHEGNKAATARALGVDRSHFHKKLRALGLDGSD